MRKAGRPSRISKENNLLNLLTTEFDKARQAADLFDQFLSHRAYSRSFCLKLLAVAKQRAGVRWDIRRLGVLMLEHQILKLEPENLEEYDFLFTELDLKQTPGSDQELKPSVLKEGYSTTALRLFIPEFRHKLERLHRVHNKIKGKRTSAAAVRDFIVVSRQHCKLTLGRYLFTPEEIVDEIIRQLQATDGVKDLDFDKPHFIEAEIKHATARLPEFEAEILKRLCESSSIYWVSEQTSSRINSLVEYPTTTVVLVIKPPGSEIEFEIKRAGRRGSNSLNVVFARDGYSVPPSHRLDGGCMQWLLRYEANAATRFGLIYRLVHGTDAPIPNYIARSTIFTIPCGDDSVQTIDYFTEPELFGKRFREMRVAMRQSVAAFEEEGTFTLPYGLGELGLTSQFMGQVGPAQAILSGTTAFRLDKLAFYLSARGPERYFTEGLKVAYSKDDAKQLADTVMEEILGVYCPPDVGYKSYEQYLGAAFRVESNRARARQVYLSLLPQMAQFWGTLLAVRGYTRGESFVARNVGLKSFWEGGQWKVKIIFMDHDAMAIPGAFDSVFYADSGIRTMAIDERYIWGQSQEQYTTSEVFYLQRIYKVGPDLKPEARALFDAALKQAYKKTQQALLTNQKLRSLFNPEFLKRLLDWDTVVGGYFRMNSHKSANARWKKKMESMLTEKGYRKGACNAMIETIEKNRAFVERYSALFDLGLAE